MFSLSPQALKHEVLSTLGLRIGPSISIRLWLSASGLQYTDILRYHHGQLKDKLYLTCILLNMFVVHTCHVGCFQFTRLNGTSHLHFLSKLGYLCS